MDSSVEQNIFDFFSSGAVEEIVYIESLLLTVFVIVHVG